MMKMRKKINQSGITLTKISGKTQVVTTSVVELSCNYNEDDENEEMDDYVNRRRKKNSRMK